MVRLLIAMVFFLLPVAASAGDIALVLRPVEASLPRTEAWTRDAGGAWTLVSRRPESFAVVAGELWQIVPNEFPMRWSDCGCLTEAWDAGESEPTPATLKKCARGGKGLLPVAVKVGSARRVLLSPIPEDITGEEGPGFPKFELLGIVGSQVIIGYHLPNDICGPPHGQAESTLTVTELSTGRATAPWNPSEAAQIAAAARTAAERAIKSSGELSAEEVDELRTAEIAVRALRARWTGPRFSPEWLLSASVAYTSSDGVWGAYTRSAWVKIDAPLPEAIGKSGDLPAALAGLSEKVPDALAIGLLPPGIELPAPAR